MATKIACSLDNIKVLTPAEVKTILDTDREGDYILLDVRQPEEYQAGHIPGAKLIPLGELEDRQSELEKGRKVIAYCRSGRRSLGAGVLLCGLGFHEVYNLEGGILDWRYEAVTGPPEEGMELLGGVVEARDALLLALRLGKAPPLDFCSGVAEGLRGKTQALPKLLSMEEEHMNWIYADLAGYEVTV